MANPAKYTPSFSFAGYQSANPAKPLPGVRVDTENNNIALSINGTITALADIRRDDGQLKNGIVTPESLDPGMALGVLPPTAWASGVQYKPPSSVWSGNKLYQCILAHVSTVFADDLANNVWNLVVDFDPPIDEAEAWAAAAEASANDAAASAAGVHADAVAAANSAASANTSKNAAATSATDAATSASQALASKNAAAGSATAADASKTAAANSAAASLVSQNAAAASASAASISASDALASKNAAATSATTANVKAGEAATSAANAASSANAAGASQTAAAGSATTAGNSATAAASSASSALASKNAAAISEANAAASAALYPDAISDGKTYGRRNAVWSEAVAASAYTAADVLAKIKTVDGAGSGLDADLLDGLSSAAFATAAALPLTTTNDTTTNWNSLVTAGYSSILLGPGNPNAPEATGFYICQTLVFLANVTQIAIPYGLPASIAKGLWYRGLYSGTWTAWSHLVPDAPSDSLTYGRKNSAWATIVGGAVISDTAPAAPLQSGQLWWQSSTGNLFIWYVDANTSQWVQVNQGSPTTGQEGEVCWFARQVPPAGFLKANGAAVSRTTYAALYLAIGTAWGVGDGSTTFNLPDLRGEFVRGWDDARGVDAGRGFGSAQSDLFLNHTHTAAALPTHNHTADPLPNHQHGIASSTAYASGNPTINQTNVPATAQGTGTLTKYSDIASGGTPSINAASAGTPVINASTAGGAETRPRNVALLACIRY